MTINSNLDQSRYSDVRIVFLTFVCFFSGLASSHADTFSTSFETEPPGDITLGTPPLTAFLTGGSAMRVGNFAYYHTGIHSWHVQPGVTSMFSFETPASNVDMLVRFSTKSLSSKVALLRSGSPQENSTRPLHRCASHGVGGRRIPLHFSRSIPPLLCRCSCWRNFVA